MSNSLTNSTFMNKDNIDRLEVVESLVHKLYNMLEPHESNETHESNEHHEHHETNESMESNESCESLESNESADNDESMEYSDINFDVPGVDSKVLFEYIRNLCEGKKLKLPKKLTISSLYYISNNRDKSYNQLARDTGIYFVALKKLLSTIDEYGFTYVKRQLLRLHVIRMIQ